MDTRIECPVCKTNYSAKSLNLDSSPGKRASMKCMCGNVLKVEFRVARTILGYVVKKAAKVIDVTPDESVR